MKKYYALLILSVLLLAFTGCSKEPTEINPEGTQSQNSQETQDQNNNMSAQGEPLTDIEWNTSGLTREQIDSIDWNTDAYKSYFRVDTDEAFFHYWNMNTCLGMMPDGDIIYMTAGQTIVVDAETEEYYESDGSFFSGIMPQQDSAQVVIPQIPSAPSEEYYFTMVRDEASDGYIFTVDLLEGRTLYYIDAGLKCTGWSLVSLDSTVSYFFGEDPGFENIASQLLPGGVPGT